MEKPTPMVNSSMLSSYRGQTVRLVGKVQKRTGNTLLVQASDMGNVEIALGHETEIGDSEYVEVTGKVSENGSDGDQIREFTTINIGNVVDMGLVENVVQISNAFPALFRE